MRSKGKNIFVSLYSSNSNVCLFQAASMALSFFSILASFEATSTVSLI